VSVLAGRSVRLRPVDEQDLPLLAGWFADPAFVEHWGGVPLTREQVAAKYVGRRRPRVESFVVLAGDLPVGYAQYWHAGEAEGGLDVCLLPSAQGRGYGPEVADTLATHLLTERGWSRVTVDPVATNRRAVRAWEKAGFQPIGAVPGGDGLLMERR
jgi:aminoglycoside 6'-N-acetyltransferase